MDSDCEACLQLADVCDECLIDQADKYADEGIQDQMEGNHD